MLGRRLLQVLGYVVLGGMTVVLAQTVMTTVNLVRVDSGLNSSLQSTRQLVQVNHAIIRNNKALPAVVKESQQAAIQLQTTLQATQKVAQNIQAINHLNSETLAVNQQIAQTGNNNAKSLQQVVDSTKALKSSLQQVQQNLQTLKSITDADKRYLSSMRQSANTMNKKTPGVG
ncbi:hypothetical protein [Alicyclobacillus sp. SO9]|uniref:hypothetical protein n=1 Tax=Alicyclobacillus sp. SO9 TaxID=2665646 RepID=UPI0018E8CA94|nr:hypothetical protein [Alicyclobacillus sp. SO9]QQE78287.1 hypothetical protein GI364_20785 [Alicyclobacillus sp. SO9]